MIISGLERGSFMLFENGINMTLIIIVVLILGLLLFARHRRAALAGNDIAINHSQEHTLSALIQYVKDQLHDMSHSRLSDYGLNEEEYRRRIAKRTELRQALKGCISGDVMDKRYVKDFIAGLLHKGYGLNETNINQIIPFDQEEHLTTGEQFDILLYRYISEYGRDGLSILIDTYDLAAPKLIETDGDSLSYAITEHDIQQIFRQEYRSLTFEEKLDIVTQKVYQHYKGFSVIDEIRDQRVDGVSGGVSGVLEDSGQLTPRYMPNPKDQVTEPPAKGWESVWLFYKGKSIHLSFLSFGSVRELKRVCQNIYKYNHPGQLSEANGYKVNEMKDGSRIVVVRPPFAESWAFFVRKFDVQNATLEQLIRGDQSAMVIEMLVYLMKGARITSITGAQGSGKTTLLMALVKHIYASYTLRVQEMASELHLREIYSRRNILSFRETENVSGQQGLDVQKKTDGTVNILGEVATDEVAAWMIQMAQVASLFTIFTHHAKTFRDLIYSLRNSLLKTGVFQNEVIAEEQVVSVINFDIHLKRDAEGQRYIERITECVPVADLSEEEGHNQRYTFIARNIIEYHDGVYVAVHPMSTKNQIEMQEQMTTQDRVLFERFVNTYWGQAV